MLNITKNINITGTSVITKDDVSLIVMTMNASVSDENSVSINKYIQDRDLYIENKEIADADYADFEKHVNEMINGTTIE